MGGKLQRQPGKRKIILSGFVSSFHKTLEGINLGDLDNFFGGLGMSLEGISLDNFPLLLSLCLSLPLAFSLSLSLSLSLSIYIYIICMHKTDRLAWLRASSCLDVRPHWKIGSLEDRSRG